jgi:hypothetical protein
MPAHIVGSYFSAAQGVTRSAAAIEREAVAGGEQRPAFARRDGGTLLVPDDLSRTTERRVRRRVVASVEALLRVARSRGDGERR